MSLRTRVRELTALVLLLPALSFAATDIAVTEAHRAQIEKVRADLAAQVQLQAYDLLDELVYRIDEGMAA